MTNRPRCDSASDGAANPASARMTHSFTFPPGAIVAIIALLLCARFIAVSTIPDQTQMRGVAFSDACDIDEIIRLVLTHAPGAIPAIVVLVVSSLAYPIVACTVRAAPLAYVVVSSSRAPPRVASA